jgi:hypothetical protein
VFFDSKFLKERLLHLAEDRLRLRPFELAALKHEVQSPYRQSLTGGWSMRLLAIEFEMDNKLVAAVIEGPTAYDTRLIALIDQWAAEQPASSVTPLPPKAPAPSVSAPLRLPAATPEKPATTPKKNRKPRASWRDELDYIAEVHSQTTQAGAIGLWRSLKTKAGSEPSPFVLGTGPDRDKLVVKSSRATLAFHTLETNMKTIREMAAEIAAQQK